MPEKSTTLQEVLDQAKQIEAVSEKFYRKSAERFEGTDVQMLFLQLADEEAGHARHVNQIELAAGTVAAKNNHFNAPQTLTLDFSDLQNLTEEGNMSDVAKFAYRLEKAASENYRILAESATGEEKEILLRLAAMEERHTKAMKKLVDELDMSLESDPGEFHAH